MLEIGCAEGDLLATLRPSRGVGIYFSPEMLAIAEKCHPHLSFVSGTVREPPKYPEPHKMPVISVNAPPVTMGAHVRSVGRSRTAPHILFTTEGGIMSAFKFLSKKTLPFLKIQVYYL